MTIDDWMSGLREQKSALEVEVRGWPEELRAKRPPDGGWCALQVLDHLVRTESGICSAIPAALHKPARIGLRDRVGFAFVERVFQTRRRVRVPRSVVGIIWPGDRLELGEIERRWDAARLELAKAAAAGQRCRGGVFRHPVSGWMTLEQVLRFFSVHMVHHEFQLQRIRKELAATSRWR